MLSDPAFSFRKYGDRLGKDFLGAKLVEDAEKKIFLNSFKSDILNGEERIRRRWIYEYV